jgi:threonine/homoserine/homoserine lactone efflux protein
VAVPVSVEQLFLQLGICGAMLLVWFRIEMRRIERNATVEDKKTEAMAAGFQSLAKTRTPNRSIAWPPLSRHFL